MKTRPALRSLAFVSAALVGPAMSASTQEREAMAVTHTDSAPAVVLTYHEYQVAGLRGEGAWELHAW